MRLLTEQEPQSIYGSNIFISIWNWLKKHFTLYVENEPQIGTNGGGERLFYNLRILSQDTQRRDAVKLYLAFVSYLFIRL